MADFGMAVTPLSTRLLSDGAMPLLRSITRVTHARVLGYTVQAQ